MKDWNPIIWKLVENQGCSAWKREDLRMPVTVFNHGWDGEEEGIYSMWFQGIEGGPVGRKRRVSREDFGSVQGRTGSVPLRVGVASHAGL